jgi:cytochrome c oxidase subunit 2
LLLAATALAGAFALAGCSAETAAQWGRFGLPEALGDRAPLIGNLWVGAWTAAMVVGVFVWGLIGWVMVRYRKKHQDQLPRQNHYNLPLELLYTLVPFLIIAVLFFYTLQTQSGVTAKETQRPVHTLNVIGQKWSWTFNYMEAENPAVGAIVHEAGTVDKIPELYLPVNAPVRFNLHSADVIHSFWIPALYYKLDVVPGRNNSFDMTPDRVGTFQGRCAEFCGTYHAAMLFTVHVVTEEEYVAYLNKLKAAGQTGEITAPLYPNTVPSAPAAEGEKK